MYNKEYVDGWNMMGSKLHSLFHHCVDLTPLFHFAEMWDAGEDVFIEANDAINTLEDCVRYIDPLQQYNTTGIFESLGLQEKIKVTRLLKDLLYLVKMVKWDIGNATDPKWVLDKVSKIAKAL